MRIAWENFLCWINDDDKETVSVFTSEVMKLKNNFSQDSIDALMQGSGFEAVLNLWNKFLDHLRHDNGDLSAFWMSYIDMVGGVLLNLLRASREGNWLLHLHAISLMIPWCFSYDKVNYARYMPVYYAQMIHLEKEKTKVYDSFMKGQFSVQMSETNTYGRIPIG